MSVTSLGYPSRPSATITQRGDHPRKVRRKSFEGQDNRPREWMEWYIIRSRRERTTSVDMVSPYLQHASTDESEPGHPRLRGGNGALSRLSLEGSSGVVSASDQQLTGVKSTVWHQTHGVVGVVIIIFIADWPAWAQVPSPTPVTPVTPVTTVTNQPQLEAVSVTESFVRFRRSVTKRHRSLHQLITESL